MDKIHKIVLNVLLDFKRFCDEVNLPDTYSYLSVKQISYISGYHRSSVQKALSYLYDYDYIDIRQNKTVNGRYRYEYKLR